METEQFFFQFEIIINVLVSSFPFIWFIWYIYYGSTAIKILIPSVRGSSWYVRIWCLQILTSQDFPRAEKFVLKFKKNKKIKKKRELKGSWTTVSPVYVYSYSPGNLA